MYIANSEKTKSIVNNKKKTITIVVKLVRCSDNINDLEDNIFIRGKC